MFCKLVLAEQGKGFVGTSKPSFKLQASIRPVLTIIK